MDFFSTVGGQRFCDSVMCSLREIVEELKRANNLKEKELELNAQKQEIRIEEE